MTETKAKYNDVKAVDIEPLVLTFREFADGNWSEMDDRQDYYEMYVIRNNTNVLYVGISESNIYNRWFSSPSCHMYKTQDGFISFSSIGHEIKDNMPISFDWIVELWTVPIAFAYLKDALPIGYKLERMNIKVLERFMIRNRRPLLNVAHNCGYQ